MSTGSTKSRARKAQSRNSSSGGGSDWGTRRAAPPAEESGQTIKPEISPRVWWIASLSVLAVAAFVRLYMLGLKPLHHDEGVNGFFLTSLFREGTYHYDPSNYHGPTLYYFALATTKLNAFFFGEEAGLSTVAVRLVPALFGIATVWLVLCLRKYIGTIGALTAAALLALSPGDVYISRYFIHETHFVFFTLGIVVASLRYWETADPVYLMLAAISAGLVFATKETAIISVVVLCLALGVAVLYERLLKGRTGVPWEKRRATRYRPKTRLAPKAERIDHLERLGGLPNVAMMASISFLLFIAVNILFYSSFFTHLEGVKDAVKALQIWAGTGTKEHGHAWYTYLWWLVQEQAPILALGVAGAVVALIRRNRFNIFAGAWAFGLLAAYSFIPYKTPWLMINFTVPLAIVSGYAVNEIYQRDKSLTARLLALGVAAVALAVSATQTIRLNFFRYDDDKYPYVYAHTYREFLPLIEKIDELANRAGTGKKTGITIAANEYWPLPWYLRNYPGAAFFGYLISPAGQTIGMTNPIVIVSARQEIENGAELRAAFGDRFVRVDSYPLRPGVELVLYARRDLVGQ